MRVTLPGQPDREEIGVKSQSWVSTRKTARVGEFSKGTVDKGMVPTSDSAGSVSGTGSKDKGKQVPG